jgi:hypothetical protein
VVPEALQLAALLTRAADRRAGDRKRSATVRGPQQADARNASNVLGPTEVNVEVPTATRELQADEHLPDRVDGATADVGRRAYSCGVDLHALTQPRPRARRFW